MQAPTPTRYDAFRWNQNGGGWSWDNSCTRACDEGAFVLFEDYEALELELAEALRQLDQERQDRKQADADITRALGERNDARAELAEARRRGDALADGINRLTSKRHTHRAIVGGDTCDICGNDFRDAAHYRVGESSAMDHALAREALAEWRAES